MTVLSLGYFNNYNNAYSTHVFVLLCYVCYYGNLNRKLIEITFVFQRLCIHPVVRLVERTGFLAGR